MDRAAVVLAGGTGSRFGGREPKQFFRLGGRTILEWSISRFLELKIPVVAVLHQDWIDFAGKKLSRMGVEIVPGGATRQQSAFAGLEAVKGRKPRLIAIHDAARPFIGHNLIEAGFREAEEHGSAIPVTPVVSSLVRAEAGFAESFPDRKEFFAIQTPQFFRSAVIFDSHHRAREAGRSDYTDDSQLLVPAGYPVRLFPGDDFNFKVTTPLDRAIARELFKTFRHR